MAALRSVHVIERDASVLGMYRKGPTQVKTKRRGNQSLGISNVVKNGEMLSNTSTKMTERDSGTVGDRRPFRRLSS
jgi:hypothetical protein